MRRAIRCRQRRPRQLRHIDSRLNIQDHSGVPSVVNWLDVGCGEGTLLQRIALQGWRVRGVERFPHLARERGLTVFDSLEQAASEGPYDGVSLWHVLEHLADPAKTLSEIHSLLDPDGVLIIAAPDAGSFAARWFGPHWMHWDVPRHLFHFSRDSLCRLLCDCGFDSRQLAVSEFEYDLMGFGQSVLNRLGMRQNMFFRILTGRRVPLSPLAKCMHLVFGASICAIASVPIWLYGRLGRGGTLVFEARPSSSK